MTILLNRPYLNLAAGSVVELPASTEAALITQGIASASVAAVTAGAYSTLAMKGVCAIAAGQSSVVITNPYVDVTSTISAVVAQAAADTTLLRVERIVPAAGSFTIFGTAAATANTTIDWVINNANPTSVN